MNVNEIIVVLIVAILVLGSSKFPDAAVQITKVIKAVKRNTNNVKAGIEKEIRIKELKDEAQGYQDEFLLSNGSIRKRLGFGEFGDLKRDILGKTKVDLTFDSREKEIPPQNPTEKANV